MLGASANDPFCEKAVSNHRSHWRFVVPIKKLRHVLIEISIAEPIEQVKKQGEGYKKGHDLGSPSFGPGAARPSKLCQDTKTMI